MSGLGTLQNAAVPMIDHAAFGPLRASARDGPGAWRWEALELVETVHGRADLAFDAGPDGPGRAHEAQLVTLIAELDQLSRAAAGAIRAELADCLDLPVDEPWTALEWEGAHLTGEQGTFKLHYACKSWPDAMITVHFQRSQPTGVQLDD